MATTLSHLIPAIIMDEAQNVSRLHSFFLLSVSQRYRAEKMTARTRTPSDRAVFRVNDRMSVVAGVGWSEPDLLALSATGGD
jgi:hypothetical protein